jgi:hypothetical protein
VTVDVQDAIAPLAAERAVFAKWSAAPPCRRDLERIAGGVRTFAS